MLLAPIESPNFPKGASTEGQPWITKARVKALRQELLASLRVGVIDAFGIRNAAPPVSLANLRNRMALRTTAVKFTFAELHEKKASTLPVVDTDFLFEDGTDAAGYVSQVNIVAPPEMSYAYKNGNHVAKMEPGDEYLHVWNNSYKTSGIKLAPAGIFWSTRIRIAIAKGCIVPMVTGSLCGKLENGTYTKLDATEMQLCDYINELDSEYKIAVAGGKSYNKVYNWPAYLTDLRRAVLGINALVVVSYMAVLPD